LLRINANVYVNVGAIYEDFKAQSTNSDPRAQAGDADWLKLVKLIGDLKGMCNFMRMPTSVTTLTRMFKEFYDSRPNQALLRERFGQWYSCFTAELESQMLLIVLPHLRGYYSDSNRIDDSIAGPSIAQLLSFMEDFPAAKFEAQEAGNCLAFERFTACVYHLMRCVEFGLISAAKSANVGDEKINKGWDGCIGGINSYVNVVGSTKTPADWQHTVKIYGDLASWFTTMQKGWRNPVSHVPRIYSEATATGMFSATSTLFSHLKKYGFKQVAMPQDPLTP
jgi:hypothetical protein